MNIYSLRFTFLSLVAMLLSVVASAQVSFTVDAPTLSAVGETLRVEFTVDAKPDKDSFRGPDFSEAGFELLAGPSQSTSRSVQWINGKESSSYRCSFTYIVMPSVEGKYTIGSASVSVDGKSYTTRPLDIEIIKEREEQRPQSSQSDTQRQQSPERRIGKDDILLRLKLSQTDVYKGEAIRASLVLYTRVDLSNIESLEMPSFNDFWSQELTFDNTPSREEYKGRIYQTYKIAEYLLSPQRSGDIKIDPVNMEVIAPVTVQDNRGFDPIFGGLRTYNVKRALSTQPITIHVKEFPLGAPASFNGAVGSFSMRSSMPQREIMANSAEKVEITLSGSGNLKFITTPKLRLPESFELYDPKVQDNVKVSSAGTTGSITYTYPFVARSAGEFVIEPIVFTYFDLVKGEYVTLSSERFVLTVKDDGTAASASAPTVDSYADFGGRMKQLDRDIRYIHTGKLQPRAAAIFIYTPMWWLVVVAMVAMFVAIYVVMRRRIRENRNIVARRMKRADKVAVQRLRLAQRSMQEGNRHAFYEEMLRAMWGYISDKFNIPLSLLTKETIREELYRRGVSASDAEQFCLIISRADEAQYAPSTDGDMGEVYGDAVEIISKIEAVVKR